MRKLKATTRSVSSPAPATVAEPVVAPAAPVAFADMRLAGRINRRANGTYPGGNLSDRDISFIAFFCEQADSNGMLPLDIVNARNPREKSPVAGGPCTRLHNAGLLGFNGLGAFTLTERARRIGAAYNGAANPVAGLAAAHKAAKA